jgi:ABC-type nickel/cobalt efflux system permease component RcnA
MPEAVTNFLQRLVAHRQKFPGLASTKDADGPLLTARVAGEDKKKNSAVFLEDGSYLFPSERVRLNLQEGVDRAAEITEVQARYLIAQFLFGRILVQEVLLCSPPSLLCLLPFPAVLTVALAVRPVCPVRPCSPAPLMYMLHTHTHTYTYTHTHKHTNTQEHTNTQTHKHTRTNTRTDRHTHTH